MILYFDSLITDKSWPGRGRDEFLKENVRKNCRAYKMPKKIKIAKYSLASYALYPWSEVFIRYELDDQNQYGEFDKYILKLFPQAKIWHERSDSQEDYIKSYKVLEKMKDDWIFYVPNNDFPLMTSDPDKVVEFMKKMIKKAEKFKKKYSNVSIVYSFMADYLNLPIKGTPINILLDNGVQVIEDSQEVMSYIFPGGFFGSFQIVDKSLFKKWFLEPELVGERIIRAEDLNGKVKIDNHLLVVPKKEFWVHFDRYEHAIGSPNEIENDRVPPLFIPAGFFNKSIKIAYGYEKYREGWVNINSELEEYSFRDNKHGTDLKISLDEIPYFWKKKIKTIDINKKADLKKLKKLAEKEKEYIYYPWKNLKLTKKRVRFYLRLYVYRFLKFIGAVSVVRPLQNRYKRLFFFLHKISI